MQLSCGCAAGRPARLRLQEMPGELKGDAAAAARHYDEHAEAEAARLERYSPIEYAIALRYLGRFVPERAAVAEVGVGAGHYSEFLARRGRNTGGAGVLGSLFVCGPEGVISWPSVHCEPDNVDRAPGERTP